MSRTVDGGGGAGDLCSARSTRPFSSLMLNGLLTKSNAPSRTASTAFSSSPKPVTMITGVPGVASRTARSTSMPSSRAFSFRSLMTRSNGLARHAGERLFGIGGRFDLAIGPGQQLLHEPAGARVVVEDENA